MDPNRKLWNRQQQALRSALARSDSQEDVVDLFLTQHAMVHSGEISGARRYSFEDEIWDGLDDVSARYIQPNNEHSIVWCFWHLARIEDVTMNMLLAGTSQILLGEGWFDRLGVPFRHTGNGMDAREVVILSKDINIAALRAYRIAVGKRTQEVIKSIKPDDLQRKVESARLEKVMAEGAVIEKGRGVIDYWHGLTGAGLLLMPPTRHAILHLNEMSRIKANCIRNRARMKTENRDKD